MTLVRQAYYRYFAPPPLNLIEFLFLRLFVWCRQQFDAESESDLFCTFHP